MIRIRLLVLSLSLLSAVPPLAARLDAAPPELILTGGKIVTVDADGSIAEALAVAEGRIVAVGKNGDVLRLARDQTRVVDLRGAMVLPGLIDSHVHATGASVYEFDHPIPVMESVEDVLAYVKSRADALDDGEWISVSQVFVTRLRDPRFPTRAELDSVAPNNPVVFRTGPDASLNSLALQLSGIDKDFQITDGQPGLIERDPATGEPTGILRSAERFVKARGSGRSPSPEEQRAQLRKLFADYNSVGLTSVADRSAGRGAVALYDSLLESGQLTCRVFCSWSVSPDGDWEKVHQQILDGAEHPRHAYHEWLWVRGVKVFLDGGMLTGSAYMRRPWGVSKTYSITDPEYRGVLKIEPERLYQIAKTCLEHDLQITAHSVGDGAVHALIDAYERVGRDLPLEGRRPCITHCNFMSAEAIERMSRLGIVADLQPAWLWLDGRVLLSHFGDERLRYFQPYRSLFDAKVVVGGGSDHMQKIGSLRSVNPYNPFLGMWIAVRRLPRHLDSPLHPEERITRLEALRLYTIQNAYLTFEEDKKGSLEPGKFADFIVIDRDLLECPEDEIKEIQVLRTYVGGRLVHGRDDS